MGIDRPSLALLSAAKSLRVDFSSTMMVGRQNFTGEGVVPTLSRLFAIHRIADDAEQHIKANRFCEPLFKLLGAKEVSSLDNSDYQQATDIHDLNLPLPEKLKGKFSLVHDGGTVEHVFNCPQAFRNCLEMVRVGGHFLQVGVSNNFTGHGFWQFSPELIYRVLSAENGFRVKTCLMAEVAPEGRWFVVPDPQVMRERVQLCNRLPTYILTIAERIGDVPIFAAAPQQSDYANPRTKEELQQAIASKSEGWSVKQLVPRVVKQAIKTMLPRQFPHGDGAFCEWQYRHVTESDVMRGKKLAPPISA